MSDGAEPSDSDLARRSVDGDEQAFSILVRRHKDSVYRFARRYVGDTDAAYEVAQETFVSAWTALKRYDPDRSFPTWLRAIALNKCRDRGRRAAVRRLIFGDRHLDSPEASNQSDPAPDAEADLIAAQRLKMLERAISELPNPLKESLLLTQFEGLSHKEAGEALGVTPKTVETRVHRARARLKTQMAFEG